MIAGRLDPVAIARISLVATSTDVYNSDACLSASSTPTIVANSTTPCSLSMTSTSDTTHSPLPLGRQSSTTSSVSAPTLSAFEGELLACLQFQPSVFPSVGGSHKERTFEQSPAYVPNYNDLSTGGAHMPPPPEPANRSIQSSFEAEYSMRSMDHYYQANFYDYIKNESNVPTIARRLNHVIKDYKLRPVACGLRWLIQDWSTACTVRLLRSIMKEWLPDVAGLLVDLIHDGALNNASDSSPFQENGVAKLSAGLLKGESPAVSAVFMHSLTDNWDLKAVSDLIADVDALLGWNETYFHQFTNSYIACVIHTTSIRSLALDRLHRKTNGGTISNRHSDATIPSTMTGGEWETSQGSAKNDGQKADEKENEKLRQFRGIGAKAGEEGGPTGSSCELQKGNLDGSEATESSLGKRATLERLTSMYQTNLAVCNYRLALANFKLALVENDIQCDLHRTHALNQAALRHSSFSGSAPNLHFGTRKDKDDSEVRIKNSLPNGDFTSHCESLISLRWAMPPDESSPAVSDRLDLTGSAISIRTLRGLDVASREEHESVPLSRLSGVGHHHAYFGSPSTGRGRRRRASCPGRVCHGFWHVDDEDDDEGMDAVQSISGSATGTERGSRRSSQVSNNAANEVRSIRSEISQTSDQYSARRSSRCSSYARSRRASSIRPPPANFLQPSNRGVGLDLPKATAQDLTIQALNRLSRPAPDLESTKDFQSLSCIHPSPPSVPTFQTCSTPTTFGSTAPSVPGSSAHRTASHYASQYNYQSSRPQGRPSATSRTSFSSSSSSANFDAYNHLTSPIHFEHPNNHYTYSSTAAYPYATHEEDPRSLFSVPPDRIRSQHPVHVPFNTSSSTSTVEHQEKSLSELNEYFNTNSCPGSMERLEYRREVGVPGDAQRARVASASFRTPARTHIGYST